MPSVLRLAVSQSHTLSTTTATLAALERTAHQAATQSVDLILFPEAYLGGYPRTATFGSAVGARDPSGREQFLHYFNDAVDLGDTPEGGGSSWIRKELEVGPKGIRGDGTREELERIARESGVFIVTGLVERCAGTLYCAVVYVCPKLGILGKRRKVMPTGSERLIWGQGQPSSLRAVTTTIRGVKLTMASAICWENYMPLLRQSLYSQNVNLYLAPTADGRDTWLPLMRTVALEGRCVVLSSNQCMSRDDLPEWIREHSKEQKHSSSGHFGEAVSHPSETKKLINTEHSRPGSSHSSRRRSIIIEDGNEVILPNIGSRHGKHHEDQDLYVNKGPGSSHSIPVTEEEDPASHDIHQSNGIHKLRRRSVVTSDGNEIALPCGEDSSSTPKPLSFINGKTNPSDLISRGGSSIISPLGEVKAGPLWDDKNGLLLVDMDFDDCIRGRLDLDVAGSYSRNDAFKLTVEVNSSSYVHLSDNETKSDTGPGSSLGTSSSASALLSTLIPVGALAGAYVAAFLFLRRRYTRVYAPRTFLGTLEDHEKTISVPNTSLTWLRPFWRLDDSYALHHQSLDGYLFLRFLKLLTIICFVGCLLTWPVLFPVNATGRGGQKQLDILSYSNIGRQGKSRYYAHTFIGWIYFSFIMLIILRETIYYINLRHAYFLSPANSRRIANRTVLFTSFPKESLQNEKVETIFYPSLRNHWFVTNCKDLEDNVEDREKSAIKLENGEIKLIKAANKRRMQAQRPQKSGFSRITTPIHKNKEVHTHDTDTELDSGSSWARWLTQKDRPTERLKIWKIPYIGKKVDTIDWERSQLRKLNSEIESQQQDYSRVASGRGSASDRLVQALFVEFQTQAAAQEAYRKTMPKRPPHMTARAIGITPEQVLWRNLRIGWSERWVRKLLTTSFLVVMIIFWAIPVAFIGTLSNINYLTDKVHFLRFINNIPDVILGVITGLLPAVLLSFIMSLVPAICRLMMNLSGAVTTPEVELKAQSWYFAFQVIQVFIVTTFTSAATSVTTQIIKNPSSATTLLAENLPKASNFYISYFIVQGLGVSSGLLLNWEGWAKSTFLYRFFDRTPRKMYKRHTTLESLEWAEIYPEFGTLGVIAIAYSCIAPLVLGFATIGLFLIYLAYRYNIFFTLENELDTQGAAYALAMEQLMTGIYLAELCLIGLFAINTSPGPIVLMAIFLGFTALFHSAMDHALKPMKRYIPVDMEDNTQWNLFHHQIQDSSPSTSSSSNIRSTIARNHLLNTALDKKAALLSYLFNPSRFKTHETAQQLMRGDSSSSSTSPSSSNLPPPPSYEEAVEQDAYVNPAASAEKPTLWIPRDQMGLSKREIQESREVCEMSDEYAWLDRKGRVEWDKNDLTKVPVYEEKVRY
ncbi:hypothetical protein B7463_g5930, partial [Scytalidium lignicola]